MAASRPDASRLLPFEVQETTLANDLKLIVVVTGFPDLVSVQIPVQTGSRNEVEPGKSGFAHFFEHMMFRGTPSYPPERYQAVLTRAGARSNAFTTDDFTNYHATFAKEDLATILELEADRFQNLEYSEAAFKTEARAVLGEYNKNSADPLNKLFELQREHAFSRHPYKHTTMGFLADIEDMPNQFEYSRQFFERWYRPQYTTLIVAGDVDPEGVRALVERHWGGWKRGSYSVAIPAEPEPRAAVYAHVPWESETLPWLTLAFHGPGFSETAKDFAAVDLLFDLSFGPTSPLYKRLVDDEQKVDQLFPYLAANQDPYLATAAARVKRVEDVLAVRDAMLQTFAEACDAPLPARRVAEARSHARYALVRSLDHTERIASTLAWFVRFRRSYDTLDNYYRLYDSLTPADLQAAARRYFTEARLVIATLSHQPLPAAIATPPAPASAAQPASGTAAYPLVAQPSPLPQLELKLVFRAGSAHDPADKPGLAALTAAMIADAGSRAQPIHEIRRALYPMAARLEAQVDKELTSFSLSVHRDNWDACAGIVLPMLLEPGLREEDFRRLKDAQRNALEQDLRSNNEEELAKERLQAGLFAGTPYGHPVQGTLAGIEAVGLADVSDFARRAYTLAALMLGRAGDWPEGAVALLERELARLPAGPALPDPAGVAARRPSGIEVEIIRKETRATAISFGHPIQVTRPHPDFVALYLARTWLGEHRSSISRLYQRIREARGLNYGDYAYIEAFPRGMFQFFPDPNLARRAQIFEVWIRPVLPENAQMALRLALHELERLIEDGMAPEAFEATRRYLMKNVFLMTATQDQRLGYAIDSRWYGSGEFTAYMRDGLSVLTLEQVNRAVRAHLSARDLAVVIVTRDAEALRDRLIADAPSILHYDAEKPPELLAEDRRIGARRLALAEDAVRITPVEDVFAR